MLETVRRLKNLVPLHAIIVVVIIIILSLLLLLLGIGQTTMASCDEGPHPVVA